MILFKTGTRQITKNFTEQELFSKSADAPEGHLLSDEVIEGAQIIRDYFGKPVFINSTFRTKKHNDSLGSNEKSQHRISTAIDLSSDSATLSKLKAELRQKSGNLWNKLRIAGITGIGIYKGFVHIDARTEKGLNADQFGNFAYWDTDKTTIEKKKQ